MPDTPQALVTNTTPLITITAATGKFAQAHVSNGTVTWTDEIDISPDTLYLAGQPSSGG